MPMTVHSTSARPCVESIQGGSFTIPTDVPESDGTFEWHATTIVVVEARSGDVRGFGYTYADVSTAKLIESTLSEIVRGCDGMDVPSAWTAMAHAVRNLGRPGIASMAISAVDAALWDLKARLLDVALVTLLGATRESVPVYGSAGFTSYSRQQWQKQLGNWVAEGITRVKMKIGRDPKSDHHRVAEAREAIGPDTELYVDANGAYSRKQALAQA